MKIVLALPTLLAKNDDVIFAPRNLFIELVNGLVDKGHDVSVIAPLNVKTRGKSIEFDRILEKETISSIKDQNAEDIFKKELTYWKDRIEYELLLTCEAFKFAEENHCELVHIYLGYQSHYIAEIAKTPSVFAMHDPVFPEKTLEYHLLTKFSNHNYIAISQSQSKRYEESLSIKSRDVVYHGIDPSDFVFSDKNPEKLAFIARFVPEKGAEDALIVARELGKKIKIVSSENYKKIPYYKNVLKPLMSSNVEESPFLKRPDELSRFYGDAKATLFPIKWDESFGMVMIESMSCGTPVIAYAEGSVPEVIKDGETGFIIDRVSSDGQRKIKETGIEGLKKATEKIYQMSDKDYSQMRRACRKRVEENFTLEKMVDGYEKVYRQVIENYKKHSTG